MKIVLIYLLFTLQLLWAESGEKIANYNVDISIHQDGTLSIIEDIKYDFSNEEKHGIYRDIPHTVKVNKNSYPSNIGLSSFEVSMDNHYVNFTESKVSADSGSNIRLKIGDASTYITAQHNYKISYAVAHGVLESGVLDAVRWNAIGTGWEVPINSARVLVHLSEKLFQHHVQVATFSGAYGKTTTKATYQWIDNKTLEVKISNLLPHEGVTVEVAFPLGSLAQSSELTSTQALTLWFKQFWHWFFLGGFWFYIHNYWKKFGQNIETHAIAVQYEAPKDMDILKSGLIFDQYADEKDFSPAIVELAQLGYLKIVDKGSTLTVENLKKDTKELSSTQTYLLNKVLFANEADHYTFSNTSTTKGSALERGISTINDNLYEWSYLDKYMKQNPKEARNSFILRVSTIAIVFIVIGLITKSSMLDSNSIFLIGFLSISIAIGLSLVIFVKQILVKIFGFLFLIIPVIMFFSLFTLEKLTLLGYSFLIIIPFIIFLSYFYNKRMGAYTQKGALAYAKLKGYKEFIKRVKTDELKRRLESDSEFLDKALPYAMMFGFSTKWINLYDELNIKKPKWYSGDLHRIDRISTRINEATNIPSSSSGGYSGGGSSSGGGSGGGGGGSW